MDDEFIIITDEDTIYNRKDIQVLYTNSGGCFTGGELVLYSGTGTTGTYEVVDVKGGELYIKEKKCQLTNTCAPHANMNGKIATRSKQTRQRNARRVKQRR